MSDLPTPQAIHDARAYMVEGYRRSVGPLTTPEEFREAGDGLARLLAVLTYAEECRAAQVEGEAVPGSIVEHYGVGPEVATPEDAGDDGWIPWEGGECPVHPGDVVEYEMRSGVRRVSVARSLWWKHLGVIGDIVRYRLAQPAQPPTDLEARVRAMSDEEVADALVGFGVDRHWSRFTGAREGQRRLYYTAGDCDEAVSEGGYCWPPEPNSRKFSSVTGDTTTPEGRAECSRRLLVHLLREEGANG